MQRAPLLLALVLVAATIARALERPVYFGAADAARCESAFGIAWPFGDDLKGSSDAFLPLQAMSLVREGFAATGGVPLLNVDRAAPKDFFYYDHHPPGVAIVTSLAFRCFGVSEAVARGVALLFSTITLVAVAGLVRRNAGDGAAALAVVAMSAPPIGLYWATHLDYFVPAMAASATFLALALREAPTRRTTLLASLALVAAMLFDSLCGLAALAAGLERLLGKPRRWRAAFGWPALGALCAAGWFVWKTLQEMRHGHGDGETFLAHVAKEWALHPQCAGVGALLGAVAGHLRGMVTLAGVATIAAGLALSFRGGVAPELRRFVRATTFIALCAGLLPRLRVFDHAYFQLWWLLPLGASAGLIAATALAGARDPRTPRPLAQRLRAVAPLLALVLLASGYVARRRPSAAAGRPSAHLLGSELAAKAGDDVRVVLLPAASAFADFVPTWYAGRLVVRTPDDAITQEAAAAYFAAFGLAEAGIRFAPDATWPGRDGLVSLKPR